MTGGTGHGPGPVRPLDAVDLPACLDLAADRGWPREHVKGRFALAAGSVFGVDDPGGGLAEQVVVAATAASPATARPGATSTR
jgi:hypothetical protein